MKSRFEIIAYVLFFGTAFVINWFLLAGTDVPRSARYVGLIISFLIWLLFVRLFGRFSIIKKIFRNDEEPPLWPEHGDYSEQERERNKPASKGLTPDSVDPREHLR